MIGYKTCASPTRVYTTAKSSLVKNFKHEWKYDVDANMATHFARGVLRRSSFLGNFEPPNKKLGL